MNIDGSAFIGCSRTILERASDELKNLGYNLKFSTEVEFTLLKQMHMSDDTNEERHNNNLIELMQF
jgi:glutamine synthetase